MNELPRDAKEQVTWGHNILANGWAGACNPIHPPPTHRDNHNCSIANTRFRTFNMDVMDGPTDGQILLSSCVSATEDRPEPADKNSFVSSR